MAKQARGNGARKAERGANINAMIQGAEGMRRAGRLEEAENLWRQMLQDFADHPQPYVGLGLLLVQLERYAEAYDLYKQAVTIAPGEFVAWRQFGICLYNMRQYEAAIIAYKKAIALKPDSAETHYDLARALFFHHCPEESLAAYDKALELRADYASAHLGRGVQLQTLGRNGEAKACFHKAIELEPDNAVTHFRLAAMDLESDEAEDLLARLRELSGSNSLTKRDQAATMFSSARILHRQKDHAGAFEHYAAGNNLLKEVYRFDRDAFKALIEDSIKGYTPNVFGLHKDAGSPSTAPIFIVGMPRSGTTLVEAIVSSHPDVSAGGEERKMADITNALTLTDGALKYPLDIAQMKSAHLLPFGTQYLSHMARLHPGAKRFTDKLPFNCIHLGLIAILFPNATVIHCRRDPMDTCLSCYFQYFGETATLSYTNDLEDLGFVYSHYERLMAHWHDVLPIEIIDVQYEDMIAAQEETSRDLIARTGLDWDDACLNFHEMERSINTASHSQVRQPIYNTSVEKWRRYEPFLGPLQEALKKAY